VCDNSGSRLLAAQHSDNLYKVTSGKGGEV
jgi:hypothetical protein